MNETRENTVKVRANSLGKYPILVVELPDGGLRTAYFETGYDLDRSKTVGEDWLRDNAIGRHPAAAAGSPPAAVAASAVVRHVLVLPHVLLNVGRDVGRDVWLNVRLNVAFVFLFLLSRGRCLGLRRL